MFWYSSIYHAVTQLIPGERFSKIHLFSFISFSIPCSFISFASFNHISNLYIPRHIWGFPHMRIPRNHPSFLGYPFPVLPRPGCCGRRSWSSIWAGAAGFHRLKTGAFIGRFIDSCGYHAYMGGVTIITSVTRTIIFVLQLSLLLTSLLSLLLVVIRIACEGFLKWGCPISWMVYFMANPIKMVYFMENPIYKWMIWGYLHDFGNLHIYIYTHMFIFFPARVNL